MKIGVIIFPDLDNGVNLIKSLELYSAHKVKPILPNENIPVDIDMVLISNGFRWIQAFQNEGRGIVDSILKSIDKGKIIIGFGEGFGLLCHLGVLPGYFKKEVRMSESTIGFFKISNANSILTHRIDRNYILRLPVLMYGYSYYASSEELIRMRQHKQILFHFCDSNGHLTSTANLAASVDNIASVCNYEGNVCGLLARPDLILNLLVRDQTDSRLIFQSLLSWNAL